MIPRVETRWTWGLVGAPALAVLVVARLLVPDVSGLGTHVQLGLPPCPFHALTSLPCPACGLTTAFAHMARLAPASATASHPLGVPLFLAVAAAVPLSLAGAWRGWSLGATLRRLKLPRALAWTVAAFLVAWIARVALVWPA